MEGPGCLEGRLRRVSISRKWARFIFRLSLFSLFQYEESVLCRLLPSSPGEIALLTLLPARRSLLLFALPGLLAAVAAHGGDANLPDAARTRTEITTMLTTFLTPAVNNTAAGHERFWADDLVYTSSTGKVMSKADIVKSFAEEPKAEPGKKPGPVFSAEDVLVRPYGDVAALTFRLVEHDPDGKISHFRNSGTFLLRDGKWQAITWQATRVAEKGDGAK
jgi:hypothetical protein